MKKNVSFLMTILLFLIVLSGCATSKPIENESVYVIPTATPIGFTAHPCRMPACIGTLPGIRQYVDTWNNIHLFQSFDYNVHNPSSIAKYYDFVWGVNPDKVAAFRSSNPNIFLSYYISFFLDSGLFVNQDTHGNLAYWKSVHPDWILYKCDRVTPAYQDVQPGVVPYVPFDFSNPDLVTWQVRMYAQPASQHGYDAIAADNANLENLVGACGSYKNGQWVPRYTGQSDDPQWRADVLTWVTRMQKALHALPHPLALIPNLGIGAVPLTDPVIQQVVSHVDGVLDESGFTNYGAGYVTDETWLHTVQFIEGVQQQSKSYYVVNETPSAVHRNEIQWVLASYLMCKQHAASLFISPIQDYGTDLRYREYNAQIGSPGGEMYKAQNVYWRDYTNGQSIVNPSSTNTFTVTLKAGVHYTDLYGNRVGPTITLLPHSGEVLLQGA